MHVPKATLSGQQQAKAVHLTFDELLETIITMKKHGVISKVNLK